MATGTRQSTWCSLFASKESIDCCWVVLYPLKAMLVIVLESQAGYQHSLFWHSLSCTGATFVIIIFKK